MDYMDYLFSINKHICKDAKIRTENLDSFIEIGQEINKALNANKYSDILEYAMKAAALIKLYQPFEDGNHRTALIVFGNILTEKGYIFDYVKALDDMNNKQLNIPTLYENTDEIYIPSKWIEYISKQKTDEGGIKIS